MGEYQVAVELNNKLVKQIGFKIVTEQEFNAAVKKGMIKSLYLGDQINSQNQIISPKTTFSRTTPKIYAVALMSNVPAKTSIKATWRYWESGLIVSEYSTTFSGSGYLPFEMDLDRVGSQWGKGTYTVAVFVDNVQISSKDFTIQ